MGASIEIIISISLAYIAYQNYHINKAGLHVQKEKLKLDLFDKRHKIFRALQELLDVFIPQATFTRKELSRFANESSDAAFLFEEDIKNYRDEICKKGLRLIHLREQLLNHPLGQGGENEAIEEMEVLEKWFMEQIYESKELFKKYLHFPINNHS